MCARRSTTTLRLFATSFGTLSTFTMLLQTLNAVLFTTELALAIVLWDSGEPSMSASSR